MSDAGDSATGPVVTSQVKLGGRSHQGGGNGLLRRHQAQAQEFQAFFNLLEDSFFQEFLSKDPCFQISDKYLLAMALVYFQRAKLTLSEYNHSSLFLALFLANDMEEDLEQPKCEIFPWALGEGWCARVGKFLRQRDALWARMDFRAAVSRRRCEEVMAREPTHWAWTRERRPYHGGVRRGGPPQRPFPRGPGCSPPHCGLCGSPRRRRCPSLISECRRRCHPHCRSAAVRGLRGQDLLILWPPQMQREPGTHTLRRELGTAGGWRARAPGEAPRVSPEPTCSAFGQPSLL